MKFKTESASLQSALFALSKVAKGKLSILNCVLIETVSDSHVAITATNLDVNLSILIDAEVEESGSCAVEAQATLRAVKFMKSEISVEQEGERLIVSKEATRITIEARDADDFPQTHSHVTQFENRAVDALVFKEMLRKTLFAAKKSGELSTVALFTGESGLRVVATDGARMSVLTSWNFQHIKDEKPKLVPATSLALFEKLITRGDDFVTVHTDGTLLTLKIDNGTLFTVALSDVRFPNFESVIPKSWDVTVSGFDASALAETIENATAYSNSYDSVRLQIADGKLHIRAESGDGARFDSSIEVTSSDEMSSSAMLNGTLLAEGIKKTATGIGAEMRVTGVGTNYQQIALLSSDADVSALFLQMGQNTDRVSIIEQSETTIAEQLAA